MSIYSGTNRTGYQLVGLALFTVVVILVLAIVGMDQTMESLSAVNTNFPLQVGQIHISASAGETHTQLIFLYQANLDGSIAERQRAASWLRTNATWVFEVEDTDGEEVPAMPGPGVTTEELKETLKTLQSGWKTKTLDELEAEFDLNVQLVESLIGLLTKGFDVSEAQIQMGVKTIWAQRLLGPTIIERISQEE